MRNGRTGLRDRLDFALQQESDDKCVQGQCLDERQRDDHRGEELTGAVRSGLVERSQVTELGAVLAGEAAGRSGPDAVTLFDSTGLAIQDLAVAAAALEAWRDGRVEAQTVEL